MNNNSNLAEPTLSPTAPYQPISGELRFKSRKSHPLHRLPFVGPVPGKVGLSFWDVPRSGGYTGGNLTGQALARFYLKHLRVHGANDTGNLQNIVLDMLGSDDSVSPEMLTLRGQIVGFFSELDVWLASAAQNIDGGLDSDDKTALLKKANQGLTLNAEEYFASLSGQK
ncbi:MAG: hypothetical protein Q7W55_09645 [Pseudohongiella sp.]|nr:hypothetical protein [Pseudohongiella sp.]